MLLGIAVVISSQALQSFPAGTVSALVGHGSPAEAAVERGRWE